MPVFCINCLLLADCGESTDIKVMKTMSKKHLQISQNLTLILTPQKMSQGLWQKGGHVMEELLRNTVRQHGMKKFLSWQESQRKTGLVYNPILFNQAGCGSTTESHYWFHYPTVLETSNEKCINFPAHYHLQNSYYMLTYRLQYFSRQDCHPERAAFPISNTYFLKERTNPWVKPSLFICLYFYIWLTSPFLCYGRLSN